MAMRAHIFHSVFWAMAGLMAIIGTPLLLVPGRWISVQIIAAFARFVRLWFRVCGVKIEYRGLENLEGLGPVVLAAKHQSWGDGLLQVARDPDLAYVIGDHMLSFPLAGFYLKRAEAVVVDDKAGARSGSAFDDGVDRLMKDERSALIFPEGRIGDVGETLRFRRGTWKLARALNRPVVPVATNLGCFWPRKDWVLKPGTAVVEYLEPVMPGEDSRAFTQALQAQVREHTLALETEAQAEARTKAAA